MFCESLKQLFPKYKLSYCRNQISITESSSDSKVKSVIWDDSCFQYIDSTIVKELTSFFQKSGSSPIFHLDCDGIILFEEDGQKYMFLTELKSTFDSKDISHAKDQIISSYIKFNMILNLVDFYNKEDYIVKGFIACLPYNKQYIRDLYREQMLPSKNKICEESSLVLNFCYGNPKKRINYDISSYSLISQLPIFNNGCLKNMEMYLIEVPEGASSVKLNVHNYI